MGGHALSCPVCATGSLALKFRLANRSILHCAACGAERVDPVPERGALETLYGEDYAARPYFTVKIGEHFVRAADAIAARKTGGRWLDLGSGRGEMLELAAARGFDVIGVEPIASLASEAASRLEVPVRCGYFEDQRFEENSFDVVTAVDFLEHLPDPAAFLARARSLLKPGGLLFVSTVDVENLVNYTGTLLYRLTGGRLRYPVERLFPEEHLTYFTRRALLSFVKRYGFEPIEVRGRQYALDRIRTSFPERIFFASAYSVQSVLGLYMDIDLLAGKGSVGG